MLRCGRVDLVCVLHWFCLLRGDSGTPVRWTAPSARSADRVINTVGNMRLKFCRCCCLKPACRCQDFGKVKKMICPLRINMTSTSTRLYRMHSITLCSNSTVYSSYTANVPSPIHSTIRVAVSRPKNMTIPFDFLIKA